MLWYLVKLLVLLPLIGLLAWGSLKFAQKMQAKVGGTPGSRSVRIVETLMLSPTQRLAVIEFRGREILIAASRSGFTRLAEAPARKATLVFFATGGHLQWIALLVDSYQTFPPGETWLGPVRAARIAGFAAALFTTAVTIALPVTLVLLVVQLLAGVLSRSAPALNLFALGLPAGVLAGFAALIVAAPMVTDRMTDLSAAAVASVAEVLAK